CNLRFKGEGDSQDSSDASGDSGKKNAKDKSDAAGDSGKKAKNDTTDQSGASSDSGKKNKKDKKVKQDQSGAADESSANSSGETADLGGSTGVSLGYFNYNFADFSKRREIRAMAVLDGWVDN